MNTLNIRELLTGAARRVAHVTRFSGTPLLRPENVAEHSYMTAQYALFIAKALEHDLQKPIVVDLGLLLSRAIVHDMDETIMGDLPRPVKYANADMLKAWNVMCLETVNRVGQQLGVSFLIEWEQAKSYGSIEGDILALADMISVTGYIVEELKMGNRFMLEICHGNIDYLVQLIERRHKYWHPLLSEFGNEAIAILREHLRDYR